MQIIWKELKHSVDVWSVRGSFCVWILVSFSWFWMTLSQQPIRKVSFWIEKCAPFATCDKDQSCAYFCDTRISTIHMIFFYHFVWLTDKKGLRYHQEFVFCAMNNIWIHYLLCQVLFFSIKRLLLLVLHLKFIINFSSLFCYCELWVPFFFVVCAPCVLCAQHRTVISILNRRKCHTNKTDSQFSDKNSIEAEPSEEIIDALFFCLRCCCLTFISSDFVGVRTILPYQLLSISYL